jgi:hypothetical protein
MKKMKGRGRDLSDACTVKGAPKNACQTLCYCRQQLPAMQVILSFSRFLFIHISFYFPHIHIRAAVAQSV